MRQDFACVTLASRLLQTPSPLHHKRVRSGAMTTISEMQQETPKAATRSRVKKRRSLTQSQALRVYRLMLLSRRIDDTEIALKRQNQIYFQISAAGHEATLAAATLHLRAGHDWFFPYYRDRTLCLGLGVTALDMFLQAVGAASDPASGGRQMPSHWSSPARHIVSEASTTGTQFLSAVGCAEAGLLWPKLDAQAAATRCQKDEVVYVSAGEGTTSEGIFFEALNTACNDKLPVLFHIEDNGYAISVPVERQTPGGNITKLLAGYPNLLRLEFDGCDPEAASDAFAEGVAYARARRGPVLLHAHVVRPYSHSLSDDESFYRTAEELRDQQKRDPLPAFRAKLLRDYQVTAADLKAIETEVDAEIATAKDAALAAKPPAADTAGLYVYSPRTDPTSESFARAAAPTSRDTKTLVDSINTCLADEMARDSRIVVFGEDVADVSRSDALKEVKGKGGVFKATFGLQRRFGSDRVFNSPLAEANIVGRAMGMALRGLKPVVEIQFFDYIWPAMMQIRCEVAVLRWRSNNGWACPMVIRSTYGGYLKGGSVYHSQTGESIFTHIPGLRVLMPSCSDDAVGLLRTAIRCEDPVLFLEHKHLYRQTYNRAPYPGPEYTIPMGKARLVRPGEHLTIITYGALVKRSLDAAQEAQKRGIDVEILDLRSLSPYDWDAIQNSVKKTGKALVVYEDCRSWGFGAEIAARIADELFEYLDGPVQRVASMDTFVGYHPDLEDAILPQNHHVLAAIEKLAGY